MKKYLVLIAALMFSCSKPDELPVVGEIGIIPQPRSVKRIGGTFEINGETVISASTEAERHAAEMLQGYLSERLGVTLAIVDAKGRNNSIAFIASEQPAEQRLDSAYNLRVAPGRMEVRGTGRGMFYGIQSLLQIIPPKAAVPVQIPAGDIDDAPRFEYRGMHLDVARHFMPVDFVKRYIDALARYKFNYFHWHLTDDQGWRIEIKQYPRLTEIGSKRPESALSKADEPYRGDGKPVEGFYTQEEIRDIVEYARARFVTIIPEIDMPGHSAATLAAYPALGCKAGYPYKVKTAWGAFPEILCPTDATFTFVENTLTEIVDLFPDSPYIHIGGDEVLHADQWHESQVVQQLKVAEGFNSDAQITAYFARRISQILAAKGKSAIIWDDVAGGGQIPNTTVMVWQDAQRGATAASLGQKVIMAPSASTYLDHQQGDPATVRTAITPAVMLDDVYRFDPMPKGLSDRASQNIIGGEGCLWTEFISSPADAEYMMFPRLLALSEALWTQPDSMNLAGFYRRLSGELYRLETSGVNCRIPEPLGFKGRHLADNEKAILELVPPIANSRSYFTTDGSEPTDASTQYQHAFVLPVPQNGTCTVKVRVFTEDGRQSQVFETAYSRGLVPSASMPVAPITQVRLGGPAQVGVVSRATDPDPTSLRPTTQKSPIAQPRKAAASGSPVPK